MKKIIVLVLFLVALISCKQKVVEEPLPEQTPLERVICEIDSLIHPDVRDSIRLNNEEYVDDLHMSLGMWVRNKWLRGHNPDTLLSNYFIDMGIRHPDDMSSIILTSYHRKMNNKPIELEAQVQYYLDYWEKEKMRE